MCACVYVCVCECVCMSVCVFESVCVCVCARVPHHSLQSTPKELQKLNGEQNITKHIHKTNLAIFFPFIVYIVTGTQNKHPPFIYPSIYLLFFECRLYLSSSAVFCLHLCNANNRGQAGTFFDPLIKLW